MVVVVVMQLAYSGQYFTISRLLNGQNYYYSVVNWTRSEIAYGDQPTLLEVRHRCAVTCLSPQAMRWFQSKHHDHSDGGR